MDALRIRPTVPKVETVNKVICTECGNEIKATKSRDGNTVSPKDVSDKLGGLCLACWKKAQAVSNDTDTE